MAFAAFADAGGYTRTAALVARGLGMAAEKKDADPPAAPLPGATSRNTPDGLTWFEAEATPRRAAGCRPRPSGSSRARGPISGLPWG